LASLADPTRAQVRGLPQPLGKLRSVMLDVPKVEEMSLELRERQPVEA